LGDEINDEMPLLGARLPDDPAWRPALERVMMDANYISERLGSMRQEISDLRVTTARYWSKDQHTTLEKSAFALRKGRLLEIKREVSDMMKRCA
jgi:hypothetical protein